MAASAAVAASVSAVAVVGASAGAAPSDDEATYVAIPPCRLVDTRPDFQIGDRSTPIGADETHEQQVTGKIGACTIPDGATAVSLNVTAVNPTAPSFLTVFPFGGAVPNASNLNYLPGSAPTPNKVDVQLSASGSLGFYNLAGTVDLVADVGGYYTNTGIQDLVSDLTTKANVADVYTKAQTYSKSQVDGALDTLEGALAIDIGDKVDVGDVYNTFETYTQTEVDDAIGAVEDAVATINTALAGKADDAALTAAVATINTALADKADDAAVTAALADKADDAAVTAALADKADDAAVTAALADKADDADLTAAIATLNTALAGKADDADLTAAIATLNTALSGKVDASDVYGKSEQEDYFMGRDPDVVMRQGTSEVQGATGLLPINIAGVTVDVLEDGLMELIGPAALDDALHGRADYRLNAIDFCVDNLLLGAFVDTVTVSIRDDAGVVTTVEDLTDRSIAGCYTVDVSAAGEGTAYYLELDMTGDILTPLVGSVRVTSVETTWVPVVAPPAPPAP